MSVCLYSGHTFERNSTKVLVFDWPLFEDDHLTMQRSGRAVQKSQENVRGSNFCLFECAVKPYAYPRPDPGEAEAGRDADAGTSS